MVNFVRRSVMRVRCSTSRDSLRVRREKFCMECQWMEEPTVGIWREDRDLPKRLAILSASDTPRSHSKRTDRSGL